MTASKKPATAATSVKKRPRSRRRRRRRAKPGQGKPLAWAAQPLCVLTRTEKAEFLRHAALQYCYGHRMVACHELGLPNGGIADVLGMRFNGEVVIFELKTCRADFRADEKWETYLPYCNYLYFLAPQGVLTAEDLPSNAGLYEIWEDLPLDVQVPTTEADDGKRPRKGPKGRPYARRMRSVKPARRLDSDPRPHIWKFLFRMADRHTRLDAEYPAAPPVLAEMED